jgi:hypothetical protein
VRKFRETSDSLADSKTKRRIIRKELRIVGKKVKRIESRIENRIQSQKARGGENTTGGTSTTDIRRLEGARSARLKERSRWQMTLQAEERRIEEGQIIIR